MPLPKLAVFDVDGTLIDHSGRVRSRTFSALGALRERGVLIALATGRPMAIADHTIAQVGGADWMSCGNGSVLFETATGRMLRDRALPDELVEPIVLGLRRRVPGVGFAIELSRTIIEEHGFSRRVPEPPVAPPVDDALAVLRRAPEPVRRVIPFHDEYDHRLDELATIVEEFLDHRCKVQFGGLPIVDISPSGDHKAAALQELSEHLAIDRTDVVAFGDGRNDIEMLEWAGIGVAMGNAHPEVHRVADVVTDPVDQDGVATFLEPILAQDD